MSSRKPGLHYPSQVAAQVRRYRMALTFSEWQYRRLDVPEADRLILMISASGSTGMDRKQIGAATRLDRDLVDELLAGLVSAGQLVLAWQNGSPVYRSPSSLKV